MSEQPPTYTNDKQTRLDPLLEALAYLSRKHLKPKSIESLTAGLPVAGQFWDNQLFIRAANQAGFNAAEAHIELKEISPLTLPVVLNLDQGNCVIWSFLTKNNA